MKRVLGLLALFLVGCSLRPLDQSKLSITFFAKSSSPLDWSEFLNGASSRSLLRTSFAPMYSCVAVNVVGYGIPATGPGNEDIGARLEGLYQGGSCSYAGITRGFFSTVGTSNLEVTVGVPTGSDRIIQIGGSDVIPGTTLCASSTEEGPEAYEWGRATADIFGPLTVAISETPGSTYQDPTKKMKCGGTGFDPSSIGDVIAWFKADMIQNCSAGTGGVWPPVPLPLGPFFPQRNAPGTPPTCSLNGGPAGQAVVTFPGTGRAYGSPNLSPGFSMPGLTIFYVGNWTGDATGASFLRLSYLPGSKFVSFKNIGLTGQEHIEVAMLTGANADYVSYGSPITTGVGEYRILAFRWDTMQPLRLYRDGGSSSDLEFSGANNYSTAVFNSTSADLELTIGSNFAQSAGGVSEVLIYKRSLSQADFDLVLSSLKSKYGI